MFYDEFQWVMDKKMKVDNTYSLIKEAILHNQKSYYVPSWNDVFSIYQNKYFLGKLFSNVKSNKI